MASPVSPSLDNLARTDSANALTGNQTISSGSLVVSTSAFGVVEINQTGTGGKQWQLYSTNNSYSQGGGKILFYNNSDSVNCMTLTSTGDILLVGDFFVKNSSTVKITGGSGSPEGVVTGGIGSIYQRSDGGAGTSMYVKESGTGNTGWVGK